MVVRNEENITVIPSSYVRLSGPFKEGVSPPEVRPLLSTRRAATGSARVRELMAGAGRY